MDIGQGFVPDYLSLDDILASEADIPSETCVPLYELGNLDPTSRLKDFPKGAKFEFPLWALHVLCKSSSTHSKYVDTDMGKYFFKTYRDMLRADVSVVDLNKLEPHFFQSTVHLTVIPHADTVKVTDLVADVFQRRMMALVDSYGFFTQLMSTEKNTTMNTGTLVKDKYLDLLERQLYDDAKCGIKLVKDWIDSKVFSVAPDT